MIRATLICLIAMAALPAQAHGTLPGGGGFYSGALHPLVALDHLLALVAGGLLLGRDGQRRPLWALAAGLAAGLSGFWGGAGLQLVVLAGALGFGSVLALQVKLPEWSLAAALLAVGLAIGLDTDLPALTPRLAASGVAVSVALITLNAFALGTALTPSRTAVVLRIAGAWSLAAALMVLALYFRVQP